MKDFAQKKYTVPHSRLLHLALTPLDGDYSVSSICAGNRPTIGKNNNKFATLFLIICFLEQSGHTTC